jgi:hypothetical protein
MAALAGGIAFASALPAQSPAWLPLEVGNTWFYRPTVESTRAFTPDFRSIQVLGKETIAGQEYFDVAWFGREVLLRIEPSYAVPRYGHGAAAALAANWEVSVMLRARTGFPIDVLTTENYLGIGFDDFQRPDLVPGVPVWIRDSTIGQHRLNPAAFTIPSGLQGNLGRNAIAGAGMSQADLALERRFRLAGAARLDLRLELTTR